MNVSYSQVLVDVPPFAHGMGGGLADVVAGKFVVYKAHEVNARTLVPGSTRTSY